MGAGRSDRLAALVAALVAASTAGAGALGQEVLPYGPDTEIAWRLELPKNQGRTGHVAWTFDPVLDARGRVVAGRDGMAVDRAGFPDRSEEDIRGRPGADLGEYSGRLVPDPPAKWGGGLRTVVTVHSLVVPASQPGSTDEIRRRGDLERLFVVHAELPASDGVVRVPPMIDLSAPLPITVALPSSVADAHRLADPAVGFQLVLYKMAAAAPGGSRYSRERAVGFGLGEDRRLTFDPFELDRFRRSATVGRYEAVLVGALGTEIDRAAFDLTVPALGDRIALLPEATEAGYPWDAPPSVRLPLPDAFPEGLAARTRLELVRLVGGAPPVVIDSRDAWCTDQPCPDLARDGWPLQEMLPGRYALRAVIDSRDGRFAPQAYDVGSVVFTVTGEPPLARVASRRLPPALLGEDLSIELGGADRLRPGEAVDVTLRAADPALLEGQGLFARIVAVDPYSYGCQLNASRPIGSGLGLYPLAPATEEDPIAFRAARPGGLLPVDTVAAARMLSREPGSSALPAPPGLPTLPAPPGLPTLPSLGGDAAVVVVPVIPPPLPGPRSGAATAGTSSGPTVVEGRAPFGSGRVLDDVYLTRDPNAPPGRFRLTAPHWPGRYELVVFRGGVFDGDVPDAVDAPAATPVKSMRFRVEDPPIDAGIVLAKRSIVGLDGEAVEARVDVSPLPAVGSYRVELWHRGDRIRDGAAQPVALIKAAEVGHPTRQADFTVFDGYGDTPAVGSFDLRLTSGGRVLYRVPFTSRGVEAYAALPAGIGPTPQPDHLPAADDPQLGVHAWLPPRSFCEEPDFETPPELTIVEWTERAPPVDSGDPELGESLSDSNYRTIDGIHFGHPFYVEARFEQEPVDEALRVALGRDRKIVVRKLAANPLVYRSDAVTLTHAGVLP